MANRITTIFEADVKNLKSGLKDVGKAMGEAHGFSATLKAGITGTIDAFKGFAKTPAGLTAITGAMGAAAVGATDLATKWSELGVEVGKFHDATGLSNDEASRLIEVTGDLGVNVDSVEGALGKMNKAAGNTPGLFKDAGVEIAHTKDGAVDANQTFLNVVDRLNAIKDPAERAATGTKLLGKGWQDMAELIGQGSSKLKESMAAVEKQKIFDDGKVEKARKFRADMDRLHDSFQDIALELGEKFVPMVESAAEAIAATADFINDVVDAADKLTSFLPEDRVEKGIVKFSKFGDVASDVLSETFRETRKLAGGMGDVSDSTDAAADAVDSYAGHNSSMVADVKRGLDEIQGKWDALSGDINNDKTWVNLQQSFDDLRQKFEDAGKAGKKGGEDAEKAYRDAKLAVDDQKLAVIDYANNVLALPPEKTTKLLAEIDAGNFADVEAQLANLTRNRNVNVQITARGGAGYNQGTGPSFDEGGVVPGPVGAPVAATVHGGEMVLTPEQQRSVSGGGGTTINLTVHAGIATDGYRVGQQIVNALAEYERRSGTDWRRTLGRAG